MMARIAASRPWLRRHASCRADFADSFQLTRLIDGFSNYAGVNGTVTL